MHGRHVIDTEVLGNRHRPTPRVSHSTAAAKIHMWNPPEVFQEYYSANKTLDVLQIVPLVRRVGKNLAHFESVYLVLACLSITFMAWAVGLETRWQAIVFQADIADYHTNQSATIAIREG